MSEKEFTGRSAAEAAIQACDVLGVTRADLTYRVVSQTGELLDRKVVIAVDLSKLPQPSGPTAPSSQGNPQGMEQDQSAADSYGNTRNNGGSEPRRRSGGRYHDEERSSGPRRGGRDGGRRDGSERKGRPGGGERGAYGRQGGHRDQGYGQDNPRGEGRPRAPRSSIDDLLRLDQMPTPPPRPAVASPSARATAALDIVQQMLQLMKMSLTCSLVQVVDRELHIDIVGADEQRLIGKRGEILLSLQFVVNRLLHAGEVEEDEGDGDEMVVLDVGGYRQRRRLALEHLAKQLATRSLAEGKAVRLSPMSAHDRRIFHVALKEIAGISTRSEGEGLYRHLLIIPSLQTV